MKISPCNNLNFNATFIDNSRVLKKDKKGDYQPCDVQFVEFKLNDKNDVKKVHEICSMPEFCSLGEHLRETVYAAGFPSDYHNTHCYALVKENEKNLDNINKKNVLGIFTAYESYPNLNSNQIAYFITNSIYSNNKEIKPNEEYTRIGTAMSNAFKKLHPDKSIGLYPSREAVKFWEKNDFRFKNGIYMIYEPKK
ncbi:hypothetical protein IJI31_02590 [bacterium]|nr:hypothetical protein [bacterium]